MNRVCKIWIISFFMMGFLTQNSKAHPHVFISNSVSFVYQKNLIAGIRLYWVFDPIFSMELMRSFDQNKNSIFEDDEIKKLGATILPNLKEYHYLTFITVGTETLAARTPENVKAVINNDRVALALYTSLPKPIDPKLKTISVAVYDPSYYIEVKSSSERPVIFEPEQAGKSCDFKNFSETDPNYWGGMIPFDRVKLVCG